MEKKTYEVTISRTETFTVNAFDENDAENIAFEFWDETGGDYDVEIKQRG